MSVGVNVVFKLIEIAAAVLGDDVDVGLRRSRSCRAGGKRGLVRGQRKAREREARDAILGLADRAHGIRFVLIEYQSRH